MKKILTGVFLFTTILIFSSCSLSKNMTSEAAINNSPAEESISVEDIEVSVRQEYPVNGAYTEFALRVGDTEKAFNGYQLAYTDPPQIHCTDLTGDSKKDIIVVFQSSSGTEVHGEDIHIFDGVTLEEYRTASLPESIENHAQVYTEKETHSMTIAEKKYTVNTDALLDYEPSGEETFYINNEYYEYRVSGDTLRLLFVCGISKYGTCGYLDVSFKLEGTEFVFDTAEFIQYEGDLGSIS